MIIGLDILSFIVGIFGTTVTIIAFWFALKTYNKQKKEDIINRRNKVIEEINDHIDELMFTISSKLPNIIKKYGVANRSVNYFTPKGNVNSNVFNDDVMVGLTELFKISENNYIGEFQELSYFRKKKIKKLKNTLEMKYNDLLNMPGLIDLFHELSVKMDINEKDLISGNLDTKILEDYIDLLKEKYPYLIFNERVKRIINDKS